MIEVLSIIGFHWIIKYSSILDKPRKLITRFKFFDELIKCSLCLGTWCGAGVALYLNHDVFIYAGTGACCCWVADNINTVLQRVDIKLEND